VAHLLAELLENATSFSPPNSKVHVVGRSVPNGYQVAVIDYGLGMSPDDLARHTRQLAEVTSFDQTSSKMLGFQVVSRIAARHGIRTVLAETPGKMGVTAIVNLPESVFDATNTHVPSSMAHDASTLAASVSTQVTDADLAALVAGEPSSPAPVTSFAPPEFAAPQGPAADLPMPVGVPMAAPAVAEVPAAPAAPERPGVPTLSRVGAIVGPFVDQSPAAMIAGPRPAGADGVAPILPEFDAAAAVGPGGLARRVKGAQMPDLGTSTTQDAVFDRPADEVRGALSSLQAGLDRVRLAAQHSTGPIPTVESETRG
jgi:hypothetical protein